MNLPLVFLTGVFVLYCFYTGFTGLKPSSQEDLVKQEAKQEPSGKEAPSYSSRLVASDCREGPDNEKKPSKTSTSDGNSTVGTRTSVSDTTTYLDVVVVKNDKERFAVAGHPEKREGNN